MPAAAKRKSRIPIPVAPPSTSELAVRPCKIGSQRPKGPLRNPGQTDLRRWFQIEGLQKTPEQVAVEEGVSPLTVQMSIDRIKEWTFQNQLSVLNVKAVQVLMSQMDGMSNVFQEGMKAEKVLFVDKQTGDVTKTPDTAMRLKTVTEIRSMMETVQPKTPALQLNQQFNGGGLGSGGFGPGMSFEAILRKKRGEVGLANEQEIEEAEVVTAKDEIEAEFQDFGGDEDDGDEDGDEEEEGE